MTLHVLDMISMERPVVPQHCTPHLLRELGGFIAHVVRPVRGLGRKIFSKAMKLFLLELIQRAPFKARLVNGRQKLRCVFGLLGERDKWGCSDLHFERGKMCTSTSIRGALCRGGCLRMDWLCIFSR